MNRTWRLLLVLLVWTCASVAARAQQRDPFSNSNDPNDPFVKSQPAAGKPVEITFKVLDENEQPVPDVVIHPRSSRDRFVTDKDGIATWKTTEERISQLAAGTPKQIGFATGPARDRPMPRITARFTVDTLTAGSVLTLRGKAGVRLSGRVVGAENGEPINNVRIYCAAIEYPKPLQSNWFTSTNDAGQWSMVIPRVDTKVIAAGQGLLGYKIDHDLRYATDVKIPENVDAITVPDFKIDPIPPLKVVVRDADQKAVANAMVKAWYHHWLSDDIVMPESFSDSVSTDEQGRAALKVKEVEGVTAFVKATRVVDGVTLTGRTKISPDVPESTQQPIEIVLQRPVAVTGKLTRDGQPASDVEVVIYESIDVPKRSPPWITTGLRGESTTNASGVYELQVEPGVRYVVALKQRGNDGRQTLLHRTSDALMTSYTVPATELNSVAKPSR
ncbi:hypothetical protein FYK55_14705 [Roseiconus nitratireducens]|uniref:Carboxypeptidase family protein n=1 Tax=Roseiconus nitratireducens TaxID=2605748 RepID=A0A5M6D5H9_9BACT|nr:hypothetical protein [Roseiconus nitratireducens]KAA5542767.1 hypothetical protein FYK55_14705 [Roseiconus nitratireducens]